MHGWNLPETYLICIMFWTIWKLALIQTRVLHVLKLSAGVPLLLSVPTCSPLIRFAYENLTKSLRKPYETHATTFLKSPMFNKLHKARWQWQWTTDASGKPFPRTRLMLLHPGVWLARKKLRSTNGTKANKVGAKAEGTLLRNTFPRTYFGIFWSLLWAYVTPGYSKLPDHNHGKSWGTFSRTYSRTYSGLL